MIDNKISNIIELTNGTFYSRVIKSQDICLVNFCAEWCQASRIAEPIIENLANEMMSKIKVFKLDVDKYRDIADIFSVQFIPTFLFFKNGEPLERFVGVTSKEVLRDYILSLGIEKFTVNNTKEYDFSTLDLE